MMNQFAHLRKQQAAATANATLAAAVIVLFSYAAISKVIIFVQFTHQLALQPFPHTVASSLAYLLPTAEMLAALLLAGKRTANAGWWLSFMLMAAFTAYSLLVVVGFWPDLPCSCGGILGRLPWGAHLAFNTLFFAVTIAGILTRKERREGDT